MGKQDLSKYRHSQSILDDAYRALAHGNRQQAGHQLKRELFFSEKNMLPGNRYEKAAHAGLSALKQGSPIEEVEWRIYSAFIGIGDSDFDSNSKQIPLNPSHSWNWSKDAETAAKQRSSRLRACLAAFLRRSLLLFRQFWTPRPAN